MSRGLLADRLCSGRPSTRCIDDSIPSAPAQALAGQGVALATGDMDDLASLEAVAVMALICADDFGAAVAAAVAEPGKFHEAEIEFAGDALTHTEIADTLSKAAGRKITAVFISREEQDQRLGAPTTDSQIWNNRVGYPARPHHAARYGLTTTTFEQWAAQQDWTLPAA
ncbi:NmrA family NAD(P)-binding protein [Streptomyces phaeoluteigriseus]|uniref:NmrA family NAD(P)-binding protein n=1 Tax=Streptomyces phaeoluteigriseus TaxID=114686 RepID=UPI0036B73898